MRKLNKLTVIALSILMVFVLIGCGQTTNTQQPEQLPEVDLLPQRIVSIVPGMTEVLFDLGLGDRIVGVTTNCDYPAEAAMKPMVGDWIINMESLLALEPDLVVGMPSTNLQTLNEIENLGIKVLAVEAQTVDEIYEMYRIVGEATGTVDVAEVIIKSMQDGFAAIQEKVEMISEEDKLRVFLEIGYEPLFSASKGSLQHELLLIAGGENVVQADSAWVEYGIEAVLMDNPDAIVVLHPASTTVDVSNRSGYQQINAVIEGRITDGIDPNTLVRPTQRTVEGAEKMAEFLYPHVFGN